MGEAGVVWEVEEIPNPAGLFLRVHEGLVRDGQLHPGIFREKGGSMSTDWEEYSTAHEARGRATHPVASGIVALVAGTVRAIEQMSVQHSPDEQRSNRAHTDVIGMLTPIGHQSVDARKTAVRLQLFEHFNTWLIPPRSAL